MDDSKIFPETKQDDLCLTFGEFEPGKMLLKQAAIKTETGFEELTASMVELGSGILLSVQSERCCDDALVFRPLEQRSEELESYRKRGCIFRRNGNPNSNFFTVTAAGDGTVWIRNEGEHSLRFQTPDGMIYRVCAGYTQALSPSNAPAQIAPARVLLDLGGNPLDIRVSAVHVKYGAAPWRQGGLDLVSPGTRIDSCICPIFCGDDCLGVLESHSDYFLELPRLEFLDVDGYGSSQWFVRNQGKAPLPLTGPKGRTAEVPADGRIYSVEKLEAYGKETDA